MDNSIDLQGDCKDDSVKISSTPRGQLFSNPNLSAEESTPSSSYPKQSCASSSDSETSACSCATSRETNIERKTSSSLEKSLLCQDNYGNFENPASNTPPSEQEKVRDNPKTSASILLSNDTPNKLSREEKIRIRKLRRRLAASHRGDQNFLQKRVKQREQRQVAQPRGESQERRSDRRKFLAEMFGKLSCVSCVDALRECCGVTNDEPTNGVKILRRKDPPVDLHADLPSLSSVSVVQRLKLILDKLESSQLDTVPPEVLQRNIQYAIQFIQDGEKDRICQHGVATSTTATSPAFGPQEQNNLSHVRQIQHQQQLLQQKRQNSSTHCVASSSAFIATATASSSSTTASSASDEQLTQQILPPPPTLPPSTSTLTESQQTPTSPVFTPTPLRDPPISSSTVVASSPPKVAVTAEVSSTSDEGNDNTTKSTPTIVIPKTDRKDSIQGGGGAANDTLSVPESRRRDESDNELSEVDEEVIPEEVRKWLASTFTKTVQPKPRLEPRPRFRSVANAIRVGLFVDRFYRQLSTTTLEIPPDVQHHLKEVNNWHFDIFKLHEKSSGHSLKYVAKELFSRYGIVSRFRLNLDKLECFLTAIEYGYTKLKNPYHNDIHAADVTQTLHYFIGSSGLANNFTDLEIFSLLFAALIHDFEHTGRTNNFHVNVGTDLALLYNDRSVLENHHVSAAFRLMRDEDKSLLTNLKPEEFRDFRNLVVEMVLSTDMSTHFAQIKNVRAILNGEKVSSTNTMSLMSLLLHTADISHPAKPWRMHKKFADTILEEFFLQGDEEAKLGLPFSPLCDRNNVLIPESQISFIEFIVEPSLTIMTDLIDFVLKVDDSSGPISLSKPSSDSNHSKAKTNSESTPSNHNNSPPKPPPVPQRQNITSNTTFSSSSDAERRTESENCIQSAGASSPSSGDPPAKVPLSNRTPSFPLQSGQNAYGPVLRPWINHLLENKSKWRTISAEAAAAAAAPEAPEEENS